MNLSSRLPLHRQQKVALGLYLFTLPYVFVRDDFGLAQERSPALALLLLPILFYRLISHFAGFGFPEAFTRDYRAANPPGPYALLFWILYLAAWAIVFFEFTIY